MENKKIIGEEYSAMAIKYYYNDGTSSIMSWDGSTQIRGENHHWTADWFDKLKIAEAIKSEVEERKLIETNNTPNGGQINIYNDGSYEGEICTMNGDKKTVYGITHRIADFDPLIAEFKFLHDNKEELEERRRKEEIDFSYVNYDIAIYLTMLQYIAGNYGKTFSIADTKELIAEAVPKIQSGDEYEDVWIKPQLQRSINYAFENLSDINKRRCDRQFISMDDDHINNVYSQMGMNPGFTVILENEKINKEIEYQEYINPESLRVGSLILNEMHNIPNSKNQGKPK